MGTILVTGATGFIGQHVARQLAAREAALRCLVRPGSDRSALSGVKCEFVEGDLTRPETLGAAVAGCSTVVHLAAETSSCGIERLHAINVRGTAELARVATEAGVERIVYLSVLNRARQGLESPRKWALVARTKLAGELAVARQGNAILLRSAPCFGPGDRLVCTVQRRLGGLWPLKWFPGQGTFQIQPIWVEDMAECVALAAVQGKLGGGPREIAGPEVMSVLEFWDAVAATVRGVHLRMHLPETLLRYAIFPLLRMAGRTGSIGLAEALIAHTASEHSFAPALLGRPLVTLEQGLQKMRSGAAGRVEAAPLQV